MMRVPTTSIESVVRTHPVVTYFVLTFTISWGGVLVVIAGPAGTTAVEAQDSPLFPLALLAMIAGPAVSGVLLTAMLDGRRGLRALGLRLTKWRVAPRWYAVALLAAPVSATAATLTLSRFSPEFLPGVSVAGDRPAMLMLGLVVGLIAGVGEELGWTGFAIPRLKLRRGVLATGLIVGLLWSAWHVLVVVWGVGDRAGAIPLALFIAVDGAAGLPAFRVLMVLVHDRTDSLLVAMLMHASLTATALILTPVATGGRLLAYGVVFAAAIWVVIAALRAADRTSPGSRPLARVDAPAATPPLAAGARSSRSAAGSVAGGYRRAR
jgi:membrane protease YdiL (CAAX protease family)